MSRLPSLFVSHGAPSFALEPGLAGPRLTALGRALPRPEAVLVVSPHWMTPTPRVGTSVQPDTIHDFGGFDPALYQLAYPARGHAGLAQRTVQHLNDAGWSAQADDRRGLDHGAWVPLMHLFPQAARGANRRPGIKPVIAEAVGINLLDPIAGTALFTVYVLRQGNTRETQRRRRNPAASLPQSERERTQQQRQQWQAPPARVGQYVPQAGQAEDQGNKQRQGKAVRRGKVQDQWQGNQ